MFTPTEQRATEKRGKRVMIIIGLLIAYMLWFSSQDQGHATAKQHYFAVRQN